MRPTPSIVKYTPGSIRPGEFFTANSHPKGKIYERKICILRRTSDGHFVSFSYFMLMYVTFSGNLYLLLFVLAANSPNIFIAAIALRLPLITTSFLTFITAKHSLEK